MGEVELYIGFRLDQTPIRGSAGDFKYKVTHSPADPEAIWSVITGSKPPGHTGRLIGGLGLVRPLQPDKWQIMYHGSFKVPPITIDQLNNATLRIAPDDWYTKNWVHSMNRWLKNPMLPQKGTAIALPSENGEACAVCSEPAVACLTAYIPGRTQTVSRDFCQKCLQGHEQVESIKRLTVICHLCRGKRADRIIHTAIDPDNKWRARFRVHDKCAKNYKQYLTERYRVVQVREIGATLTPDVPTTTYRDSDPQ